MSRKSKIRWRESDTQELRRRIKNFNAKISRLEKKFPDADYLPQRMSMKEVKANIETRADLKRTINSLQRFSKKGAEQKVQGARGLKKTKWEIDEAVRKNAIIEARKTRERKKIEANEVKFGGVGQGKTRAEMGSIKENSLKPRKPNINNMSKKEFEMFAKNVDKMVLESSREKQKENYKNVYIKTLQTMNYPDDIVSLVKSVDIDLFIETTATDEAASMDFFYDPLDQDVKIEQIRNAWTTAVKETSM